MADEWVELGRITINDLVKQRQTERDTHWGGKSAHGCHLHCGQSHSCLYRLHGVNINYHANFDRATYYHHWCKFNELPAYVDICCGSHSLAHTPQHHNDHSPRHHTCA